jgi:hypothetical protein
MRVSALIVARRALVDFSVPSPPRPAVRHGIRSRHRAEEIMAGVQFRLRSLIIAVVIVALLLALGIQSVRVQQLQARAELAAAEVMHARAIAELAAQRAASQLAPQTQP